MLILQIIFWASVLGILWTYFGYPVLLAAISLIFARKTERAEIYPGVTLIVPAYNEEKRIGRKIENALGLNYPMDKLEIIIVSDGSTDKTNAIVQAYEKYGVKLLMIPERRGKHYGQGQAVERAAGELIVFSDAATMLDRDAIRNIVSNFADPAVGCVSGRDVVSPAGPDTRGEGLYVRYEMALRTLESRANSVVGMSGSFYAIRKKLCDVWYPDMSNDFYMPILSYLRGYKAILDPTAIGSYEVTEDPEQEFRRKVRTVTNGMTVLYRFRRSLNPFKFGLFSVQLISHKLLRWLVPLFMVMAFVATAALAQGSALYRTLFLAQVLFYFAAILSYLIKSLQKLAPFRVALFFVMVNLSIAIAWYTFLMGRRFVTWEPTER